MKSFIFSIILLILCGTFLFSYKNQDLELDLDTTSIVFKAFETWKTKYNKTFDSKSELLYRFLQFQENYHFINNHNQKDEDLKLAINDFAALSLEEFQQLYLKKNGPKITNPGKKVETTGISVDWIKKGAILPPLNQGTCGSCWAFSTIGGLQGLRWIIEGVLERLSVQQLVSCLPKNLLDPGAQDGCGGAEPHGSYTYTHQHGIETWQNYPYVSAQGYVPPCHHKDENSVFFNKGPNNGYERLPKNDVQGMKKYIQQQPLNVDVASSNKYWKFYKEGILKTDKCGTDLDHVILLVGMHDQGEEPYWVVQNSFGPEWGDKGFAKLAITDGDGVCGVNMQVEYPTSIYQNP